MLGLRMVPLLLLLLSGSSFFAACHKDKAPPVNRQQANKLVARSPAELKRDAESARQALAGLGPAVGALNAKITALREQFDPLPPGLPGFGETRGKFYATAEGVGRMSAKVPWLSGRIDAALKAGDSAELSEVAKDIAHSYEEVKQVEQIANELSREVAPFKHVVEEALATGKSSCE